MITPKVARHDEIVPDTVPTLTANRTLAQQIEVQVVPTRDPEGMAGDPARALTRDLRGTRKACLLN